VLHLCHEYNLDKSLFRILGPSTGCGLLDKTEILSADLILRLNKQDLILCKVVVQ